MYRSLQTTEMPVSEHQLTGYMKGMDFLSLKKILAYCEAFKKGQSPVASHNAALHWSKLSFACRPHGPNLPLSLIYVLPELQCISL